MLTERELVEKWQTHVFPDAREEIRGLLEGFPGRRSLPIPYESCGADYRFSQPLLNDPDRTLAAGRRALERYVDSEFDRNGVGADDRIYFRVSDVPGSARVPVDEIRAEHLNRLVGTDGVVDRVADSRPRMVTAAYRCDRCGELVERAQRGRRRAEPAECPSCAAVGTCRLAPRHSEYVDSQVIHLRGDDRSLRLSVEHDLAEAFDPGDELGAIAIPRAVADDESTTVDVELEALNAHVRTSA